MAPPVEEMETRDVRLVLSDMIKYGRYEPITTGQKLGYQPTLSSTERAEAARARPGRTQTVSGRGAPQRGKWAGLGLSPHRPERV